tara:strand:+ start:448 stop:645 length:198 start_codon:yes stop_codon:yes gene_type:complete
MKRAADGNDGGDGPDVPMQSGFGDSFSVTGNAPKQRGNGCEDRNVYIDKYVVHHVQSVQYHANAD